MTFNSILQNLKIYEAGKPIELVMREYAVKNKDIIKLASNENPYGTSQKVVVRLKEIANNAFVYPDDSMYELKDALATKFKVDENNIIIGAGSDQVIEFCVHAKCDKNSKVIMAKTTFAMYEIYAKQTGATILKTASGTHNLDEFMEIYKKQSASIIFLCLPNNPLGECLDAVDVYNFLDKIDKNTLVVLDGAYQEYAKYKDNQKAIIPSEVISKYSNVIYLGTFSKAYALGGMRVGYGIANKQIIQNLYKLRPPFNITTLSLASCIEALKDEEFVSDCIYKNFTQMKRYEEYATSKGFKYIPSYTNFILIYLEGYSSKDISQRLLEKGVIVRDMTGYGLNAIRITIGTSKQNTKVFEIMDSLF
ncbi:Biosynthetic Aromatic amino acid aminotransferase beta @ Histidinol-phosphate aminotransferase [hydrothermal vent metagenome]|uniref:Biosynthetic Aromatic amino acid aminotransferase beta @ Histidinol-phosphate aminotransferase n=1 Tax=hydrothermal vent metagenome TaxID=652676 RepID=A0A3B1DSI8_9ZZZZ